MHVNKAILQEIIMNNPDNKNKDIPDTLPIRRKVRIGIGAKLSLFTGALIASTVLIISSISVWQQSKILSVGYNREAASSRLYISSFVLELDNIAENLIHIEEFRNRVKLQKKELKKYQIRKRVTYKNKVSLFGVKTDLFGTLGKRRVYRKRDTYYSEYLSDEDIKSLETRTKALLQAPGEPPISDSRYNKLVYTARKYVQAKKTFLKINEELADSGNNSDAKNDRKHKKLQKALARVTKSMRWQRARLGREIVSILAPSRKRKIKELGLDIGRFRIQMFPEGSAVPGETSKPTLDTKIFGSDSDLNGDIEELNMQSDLELAFTKYAELNQSSDSAWEEYLEIAEDYIRNLAKTWLPGYDPDSYKFKYSNMDLRVQYSPHFRNPTSSIRADILLRDRKKNRIKQLNGYLVEDARIAGEIEKVTYRIDERLNEIRGTKPPIPPYRDSRFKELYRDYEGLIRNRTEAYENFTKRASATTDEKVIDAVGYLRDAVMEDLILIHFYDSPVFYDEYMNSEKVKNAQRKNWQMVRKWIYSGKSETPPVWLKKRFMNGMIGFSRAEAEQTMWKLDTTPLLSMENTDVADIVNEENFSGIVRTIIDDSEGVEAINKSKKQVMITALLITGLAIVLSIYLASLVTRNIKNVIQSAEDVGHGNLNVEFKQLGRDEFGNLSLALNHMVTGLREREKVKGILGSMVDPVVIGEAMKDIQSLRNGTEKRITSFFSDVAGFSTISEKMTSIELAELLNEYLSAMTIILKDHDGVLDKYIGDAIVGMFNAPVDVENHTLKAVQASFRMLERMRELQIEWNHQNKFNPEARNMQFRIGLNTGPAKVGFMGTDALASYTMMGDTVNLAARLESAAKDYGVSILGSQSVYDEVKDSVMTRKLDFIRVKGRNESVTIYEFISDSERRSIPRGIKESAKLYENGLELYLERQWGKAISAFQDSEKMRGKEDKAAQLLIKRIEHYRKSPPPDEWDGVFTRDHK